MIIIINIRMNTITKIGAKDDDWMSGGVLVGLQCNLSCLSLKAEAILFEIHIQTWNMNRCRNQFNNNSNNNLFKSKMK